MSEIKMGKKILFQGILQIKPNIKPLDLKLNISGSDTETLFKLSFDNTHYDRHIVDLKGKGFILESSCFIELINTQALKNIPSNIFYKDFIIQQIENINKIFDIIRYSYDIEHPNTKIHLRNIGLDDFIFYSLSIDNKNKIKVLKDTFVKNLPEPNGIFSLADNVPDEWNMFMKAIDLLDLGYYNESLIIGFNLLDHCTQKSLMYLMKNLNEEEKKPFLRKIEHERLVTYLGSLMKLITGRSLFNTELSEKQFQKLNKFRNDVVHNGHLSTYEESCNNLKIIHKTIKALSTLGLYYSIPNRIIFY